MWERDVVYYDVFSSVCETNELDDQFNLLLLCSIPTEETKKEKEEEEKKKKDDACVMVGT